MPGTPCTALGEPEDDSAGESTLDKQPKGGVHPGSPLSRALGDSHGRPHRLLVKEVGPGLKSLHLDSFTFVFLTERAAAQ